MIAMPKSKAATLSLILLLKTLARSDFFVDLLQADTPPCILRESGVEIFVFNMAVAK